MRDLHDLTEAFRDMVRDEIQKTMAMYRSGRFGLVDSWSAETQTAKVKLQPSGTLTGWLPFGSQFAANNAGFATGLTPGDQVWVQFQEGSITSGIITHRVWSQTDKAVQAKSGEVILQHGSGNVLKMLTDKTMALAGQSSSQQLFDASGNIIFSSSQQVQVKAGGSLKAVKLADGSNSNVLFATS